MVEDSDVQIAGLNRDIEYLKDRLREMHDDLLKARDSAFMVHRLSEKTVEIDMDIKKIREDLDAATKLLSNWRFLAIALGTIGAGIGYLLNLYFGYGKTLR